MNLIQGTDIPIREALPLLQARADLTEVWLMAHSHRGQKMTGFCVMLCTVHTAQEQGQAQGTIVFYCTHIVPCSSSSPSPVKCV